MEDNTEKVETPVISFEQSKAILKIAYLLASVDGTICEKEQEQFRTLMRQLFDDRYAEVEVMTYLEDVAEDARKLIALRSFYTEDEELVKAFIAKASSALATIVKDVYVLRCAFAIWIGICCADNEYSKVERLAVKSIQRMVNPNALFKNIKAKTGVAAGVAAAAGMCGIGLAAAPVLVGFLAAASKFGSGISITDAFLAEVEKRVRRIGELNAKLESAEEDDVRQNYKDMYDFEVENFKEFLADK